MRKRKLTKRSKGMAMAHAYRRSFGSRVIFESFIRQFANNRTGTASFTFDVVNKNDVIEVTCTPVSLGGEALPFKHEPFLGYLMRGSIEPKTAIDNIVKYFTQDSIQERIDV